MHADETMKMHAETLLGLSLTIPMVTLRQVELLWLDRALRRFARAALALDATAAEEISQLPPLMDELPAFVAANTLARTALKWSRELHPEDLVRQDDQDQKPRDPRIMLAGFAMALSRVLDAKRPRPEDVEGELLEVVDIIFTFSEFASFDLSEEMHLQLKELQAVMP